MGNWDTWACVCIGRMGWHGDVVMVGGDGNGNIHCTLLAIVCSFSWRFGIELWVLSYGARGIRREFDDHRNTLLSRSQRQHYHTFGHLIERMPQLEIEPDLVRWTEGFMSERRVRLVINGQEGTDRDIDTGSPASPYCSPYTSRDSSHTWRRKYRVSKRILRGRRRLGGGRRGCERGMRRGRKGTQSPPTQRRQKPY